MHSFQYGNNKMCIWAERYCKIPVFTKFLIEPAADVPVHRNT